MKRRDAELAIAETLEAVVTIKCGGCGQVEEVTVIASDGDEAACFFYDQGFRIVGTALLCEKCRRRGEEEQ